MNLLFELPAAALGPLVAAFYFAALLSSLGVCALLAWVVLWPRGDAGVGPFDTPRSWFESPYWRRTPLGELLIWRKRRAAWLKRRCALCASRGGPCVFGPSATCPYFR